MYVMWVLPDNTITIRGDPHTRRRQPQQEVRRHIRAVSQVANQPKADEYQQDNTNTSDIQRLKLVRLLH